MSSTSGGKGFLFAAASYVLWGILPLFWKLLTAVDSLHILAFRILFSLLFVAAVLFTQKNTVWLTIFKEPKKALILIPTAIILCCNWGLFILAVNSGHTLEASLGYYINPLVSIVLGLLFFHERLKPLQWAAAGMALTGVIILAFLSGALPLISLGLALTFGIYSLLKKKLNIPAIESLGAETLASAPIGIALLFFSFAAAPDGSSRAVLTGPGGLAYIVGLPVYTLALIVLSGFVTALPLYFFAEGVKRLPLSVMGFIQFLSPTLQFLLGMFVFGESFPVHNIIAFGFIWTAVILYIISLKPKRA